MFPFTPPSLGVFRGYNMVALVRNGFTVSINNSNVKSNTNRLNIVDMRPQLNVHKTFTVHLERHMNKLITLNLNSVSSGHST